MLGNISNSILVKVPRFLCFASTKPISLKAL